MDPDAQHFLHAVLRRLGFQFACGRDERHQRHMHKERVLRSEFESHLSNRFEEGKRLDIANRSADLHDHHFDAFGNLLDRRFDLVGHVRDHLHGFSEIIPAPLLRQDRFVDSSGRPVIVAGELGVREPLVVPQVQVRFRTVFGHKHFAVLKRAHGARVHVQVWIAFLKGDFETATFEETTD